MKFQVEHTLEYVYTKPVFLEPHVFRWRPRNDPAQRETAFQYEINPAPSQWEEALDAEGNSVAYAWFDGMTDRLRIHTSIQGETLRSNPFGFLFASDDLLRLPVNYADNYLLHSEALRLRAPRDPAIDVLVREALQESGSQTMPFLTTLSRLIFERASVVVRHVGKPRPPAETVRTMRGACRDFAVLFNECCRTQGLATRFVTGYHEGDPDVPENYLHAWSEVYLPGGGWRGFDPTLGLAVADRHLALAASVRPVTASRVEGTFRGTGARAEMKVSLSIQTGA